ncbi:uncharacterized protein L969DRAFT_499973 [Mixia osmundae IAM 14324]|uniref:uncharacterized protein n=1 Tax=Mixia osmundae (strain CBS 9802 / IAM 14324 / JCM 22182 / KY 12970) TaxID=764103 RepID=UPI0004A55239|nr:uncharacterized protein L969DRAFT_499973 [Mixia osmundae IAM 14324]KEI38969.1 hypothetical protein L969DRAFT_499973 [Mixia osmundae IAM 14324]
MAHAKMYRNRAPFINQHTPRKQGAADISTLPRATPSVATIFDSLYKLANDLAPAGSSVRHRLTEGSSHAVPVSRKADGCSQQLSRLPVRLSARQLCCQSAPHVIKLPPEPAAFTLEERVADDDQSASSLTIEARMGSKREVCISACQKSFQAGTFLANILLDTIRIRTGDSERAASLQTGRGSLSAAEDDSKRTYCEP